MVKSLFHLYFRSSHHLYFIFLSRVKINSINWPTPNIWVFIAQLVEHCSANAEAMGSNPVEALKFFSGLMQLLKLRLQLRWSNLYLICISAVHIIFINFSLRNDLYIADLENLCIEVRKPHSKPLIVVNWHRPPNSPGEPHR